MEVMVLLSAYNGEKYLDTQLQSLREQIYEHVRVIVRDDGSTDNTIKILEKWHNKYPEWLTWYSGTNIGYKKSFITLLYDAPESDYYAFCDQDDFWKEDKLEAAVNKLKNKDGIVIYTSNVTYCDDELKVKGDSKFYDNNTLWKALLYNQAVGCTMLISKELKEKIRQLDLEMINFNEMYSHDCWIYRLCLAFGGESYFDTESHILYRQHGNNQIGGSASSLKTWLERANKLKGRNRNIKLKTAREIEKCYREKVTDDARQALDVFNGYNKSLFTRLNLASKRELYNGSFVANISLWIAIMLGAV